MITLNRNIIYPFLGLISVIVGILILLLKLDNYLYSTLVFLYIVTVPGFLILRSLGVKKLDFWISLILSVGLSITFLMIPGILFNFGWSYLNKVPPLQTELMTFFYGIQIILLLILAYFRNNIELIINIDIYSFLKKSYYILPPILVVMSILSANLLNNGGSNILAIITLVLIALGSLITILFSNSIDKNFFPWSLYFYSLSLLLLLSLRSLYVSGWDIQSEFGVFQMTKIAEKWQPTIWNGAYNACLSITLLPTIISKLTQFPDDYIYKFFYQILFAFTPIIIYQFFKKFASHVIAFIAVIYIISQPLFVQPMTALMRQEIAFLFFMLMTYVLFDSHLNSKVRVILIFIFGLCMVLSHYSTTYITLLLLTLTYIFTSVFRLTEKIPLIESLLIKIKISNPIKFHNYYLSPLLLLFLFLTTFLWYGTVNNQLGQVQKVATEGWSRMNELFQSDSASNESKQAVSFLKSNYTTSKDIQDYTNKVLNTLDPKNTRLYAPELYANYNVQPLIPNSVKPMFITPANKYILISFEVLKQFFKLAVILGPLYLLIFYFKKHNVPREYIIFCLVSVIVIFLVTFHPYIGRQYNLSRLYLQLLFYLSLPAILVTTFVFYPLKKFSLKITGVLVIFIFVYLVGLPNQILGGEAKMYLNNYGADYDKFYMHKEEFASAKWLKFNVGTQLLLYADREAYLRIFREYDRGHEVNVIPALIYRDAYVYGSFTNIISNRTTVFNDGSDLLFTFPKKFLEDNKNVIYSNGKSTIYR